MTNDVFFAACATYDADAVGRAAERIISFFGGTDAMLARGKRVFIKANLVMERSPAEATTTHPAVVAAIAERLVRAGARVTIGDSPGAPFTREVLADIYRTCGMEDAAARAAARLNDDFYAKANPAPEGAAFPHIDVINACLDCDVIINIAKLKTHVMAHYTGAVKNMFGCVPGLTKPAYHARLPKIDRFCAMLVDLCRALAPAYNIIDGIEGMDARGPTGGRKRSVGVLIASENPHAADFAASRLVGLRMEDIPTLVRAEALGLFQPDGVAIAGDALAPLAEPFLLPEGPHPAGAFIRRLPHYLQPLARKWLIPPPRIDPARCVGCGICARSCPQHTIKIADHRAKIIRKACIRCYCCHEMCPHRAVEI